MTVQARFCRLTSEDPLLLRCQKSGGSGGTRLCPVGYHKSGRRDKGGSTGTQVGAEHDGGATWTWHAKLWGKDLNWKSAPQARVARAAPGKQGSGASVLGPRPDVASIALKEGKAQREPKINM